MSITYKELKDRLTDLGFEEDDVAESEYSRIYVNSFNRAGEIIYSTIMLATEGYMRRVLDLEYVDEDGEEIALPKITKVTVNTPDTARISIADELVPLYTLLAAHYAWLDDDLTKATIYWNEFDDLKNQFITNARTPRRAVIVGGF